MEGRYWNEEIETMPRAELEEYQLRALREELEFAYENSPYYRRSFDAAGVKPGDLRELGDISRFPFIDKKTQRDAQGVGSFLGELCAVPEEDVVFISTSSGSTGVPTMSPFTQRDFDEWQDVESRIFYQAGMRRADRYLHALNFSLYVGGPDVIGAQRLGALCIWGGTIPSDRLIYILQTYRPTCMWTSPSYAWHLGETCMKNGIDPAKDLAVRRIFVAGEMGGSIDGTRKAIEELWGAELYDFYGLSDIFGACAGMCGEKDGLHIAEDHILVETVDVETGEPLAPGETGELVYTTLRKRARPMIRFRTGDIGRIDKGACRCGRTHGRIHVMGRKDDMFIVSAVNVFPSDIEAVVRGQKGITGEYLIRVTEKSYTCQYEVTVERSESNSSETDEEVADRIQRALKARIGVKPARVVVEREGALERSLHKARRIIDERKLTYSI
ncbi:MAG: phenylacetate--CoA ligase [Candidatus Methanoplasma sp.]|nr:phenylacetate--CoA ligase [Candidatus Methanoplasma sp.]